MTDTVESDCTGSAGCQTHPCLGQIRSSHTLDLCTTDRIADITVFATAQIKLHILLCLLLRTPVHCPADTASGL